MMWGDKIYALFRVNGSDKKELVRNPVSYLQSRQMEIATNYAKDLGKTVRNLFMESGELCVELKDGSNLKYTIETIGNVGV